MKGGISFFFSDILLSFNMNNRSVKVNNNDSESNSNKAIKRFIKYYNDPMNDRNIIRREKSQIEKGINTPYRKKYLINIKRG